MNYQDAEIKKFKVDDAVIAMRSWGDGAPLLFIHGFGVHGYTWRKLIPTLAKEHACYVVDLPGFGDSEWDQQSDLTFTAQATRLSKLMDQLGWKDISIIAQDTGASIARLVALSRLNGIKNLVMINTEMPNHRPPFIPMHQFLAQLPLSNLAFRSLLKVGPIVRSPLLFAPFFYDKTLLKQRGNVMDPYVSRLRTSHQMLGMLKYLKGIEWKVVDGFQHSHRLIEANVLLVWGENDVTFPLHLAKKMVSQFNRNCELAVIPKTCLMPHEERPEEVLNKIVPFLKSF